LGHSEDILGNMTTEAKELLEIFVLYIFSAIDIQKQVTLPPNCTTNFTYPCIQETTGTCFSYFISPSLGSTDIQRKYMYMDLRSRTV